MERQLFDWITSKYQWHVNALKRTYGHKRTCIEGLVSELATGFASNGILLTSGLSVDKSDLAPKDCGVQESLVCYTKALIRFVFLALSWGPRGGHGLESRGLNTIIYDPKNMTRLQPIPRRTARNVRNIEHFSCPVISNRKTVAGFCGVECSPHAVQDR